MTFYNIGKRLMDIVGSIVGIIIFSPIMLLTALYIKLVSSEGPVFVEAAERVGEDGKKFNMYKFRTMIPNAQEWLKSQPELYKKYQENSYKLDPDPRFIKGAKFLRQSSSDELPQFFNVLKGEMSLVGPRAYYQFELKEQSERFKESEEYINRALTVKPGITGVWQISGRSNINFVDRIKMDAEYARKRSLLYDLIILLKTPAAVFSRKGAI